MTDEERAREWFNNHTPADPMDTREWDHALDALAAQFREVREECAGALEDHAPEHWTPTECAAAIRRLNDAD